MRRVFVNSLLRVYKRNTLSFKFPSLYTYSTNQNNFKGMDPVEDITKKVEEVKLESKSSRI
jgi:hypothetical protein